MENKCSKIALKYFFKAHFIPFRKNMLPNIEMGIFDCGRYKTGTFC